jgi:hypothetical protein
LEDDGADGGGPTVAVVAVVSVVVVEKEKRKKRHFFLNCGSARHVFASAAVSASVACREELRNLRRKGKNAQRRLSFPSPLRADVARNSIALNLL